MKDLPIPLQHMEAFKLYHGGDDIVSKINFFLSGQLNYENIWEEEGSTDGLIQVIPEKLHHQWGKKLICGKNVSIVFLEKAQQLLVLLFLVTQSESTQWSKEQEK
jgi:hypothetical protein